MMNGIICDHADADKAGLVCEHLLNKGQGGYYTASEHFRFFTGHGADFVLICPVCAQEPEKGKRHWRPVCNSCVEDIACGKRLGDAGSPEIRVRNAGLALDHRFVPPGAGPLSVAVAQPSRETPPGSWLILTTTGQLVSFDGYARLTIRAALASDLGIDCRQPTSLFLSPNGRFAAAANMYGHAGAVIDLDSGDIVMKLARGNYYPEHCKFPVAFFEHDGRQLLVHGTDWNRLEISDPATGELLTGREPTTYKIGGQRPAHFLDYFHCGLSVSPDGQWIADNGWVWHPMGVVTTWSLVQWLKTNLWESEDGPSKKGLCSRDYFWDGPLCWVDNRTVAVWGLGDDDILLIGGVRLIDVESGTEKRAFVGPAAGEVNEVAHVQGKERTISHRVGVLLFDRWLFSWLPDNPFTVWDITDGARLLEVRDFTPLGYHPATGEFLSILPDGSLRLSKIHESVSEMTKCT